MRTHLLLCLVSSSSLLLCQQTWLVNGTPGPGVDFADLPQAVAAAAPGDTILVELDVNNIWYTAATIDKPLQIVGLTSIPGPLSTNSAVFQGQWDISGIPAGERLLLSNVFMNVVGINFPALSIHDCAGSVMIEDYSAWSPYYVPGSIHSISNCADITLRGWYVHVAGNPIDVINSNVLMTNCLIQHSYFPLFPPPPNPPGVRLTNSTLTVIGSIVNGMYNTLGPAQNNAAPAVELHDSVLRVGAFASLRGGNANGIYWHGYEAPVLDSSVVYKDFRATITTVSSFTVPPPTPQQLDATMHSYVVANRYYAVTVAGPPAGFAVLVLGELIQPTPTPFGLLSLDPLTAVFGGVVPLAATDGSYDWPSLFCPPGVPSGVAYAFQCLTLSPQGVLGLTLASPFTVGWQPGVSP